MFVVSDSKDATNSILHKWLDEGRRGRVPDLGSLEQQLPLRTERLALVRNPYMDQVRVGKEAAYDHLIVVDLDDVLATPVSTVVFARWLDAAPTRGGVFANGSPRYYDIWTLRHNAWCSYGCWHPVRFRETGQDKRLLEIREVFARMVKIPLWVPPIRVLSAFGGIGIYKLNLAVAARYVGLDDKGRETCEHVAFNAGVHKAGGQLYIYSPLVTRSGTSGPVSRSSREVARDDGQPANTYGVPLVAKGAASPNEEDAHDDEIQNSKSRGPLTRRSSSSSLSKGPSYL
jgi:hypothetical protein